MDEGTFYQRVAPIVEEECGPEVEWMLTVMPWSTERPSQTTGRASLLAHAIAIAGCVHSLRERLAGMENAGEHEKALMKEPIQDAIEYLKEIAKKIGCTDDEI